MNARITSCVLVAALCAAPAVVAYSRTEILNILFVGIRSRDPAVARAVVLVRQRGLLEARHGSLERLAAIAEKPEVLEALTLLARRGFLPDAQLGPQALSDYLGQVHRLQEDEQKEQVETGRTTLLRMGRATRRAPFYVRVPAQKVFVLGGMLEEGAEVEMTCARTDGFAEVVFPSIHKGYVNHEHLEPISEPAGAYRQGPGGVLMLSDGPIFCYRVAHKGARLFVTRVDLEPEGEVTLRPFVTGQYNLAAKGPEKVEYVHDAARRANATVSINGTFFINSPGKPSHGMPLAPIVIAGRPVWSYGEPRVLNMNRAYVAVTSSNRVVIGETTRPSEELTALASRGALEPDLFKGEKLVHLLGGLGWLVKDGDREAWRKYAGTQFGYSYYSHYVRRPQTVLAASARGRRVWLVVQEGRPHSSRPLSLPQLAAYVVENFHAPWAVFLDGGGSSEMVLNGRVVTRQENDLPYRKNSTALFVMR